MRVVVAAEPRELQRFLADIVEEQPGTVIVGQAENAVRMISTVDNLAPDVTIIDSNLPYAIGLEKVALSRASGLDVAQGIAEKRPKVRVILLTNLDKKTILNQKLDPRETAFYLNAEGTSIPFTLQDLGQRSALQNVPVFARLGARPKARPKSPLGRKTSRISSDAIFLGGLGILGGLLLTITWILTPVGVVLAASGVASVFFGLVTKAVGKVWH